MMTDGWTRSHQRMAEPTGETDLVEYPDIHLDEAEGLSLIYQTGDLSQSKQNILEVECVY